MMSQILTDRFLICSEASVKETDLYKALMAEVRHQGWISPCTLILKKQMRQSLVLIFDC